MLMLTLMLSNIKGQGGADTGDYETMCLGMAHSAGINSKRSSALVFLLVATNFAEIKGEGADSDDTQHHVNSFAEIQLRQSTRPESVYIGTFASFGSFQPPLPT